MMRVLLRLVLLGSIATAVGPVRVLAQPAPAVTPEKAKVAKQYVAAGLAAQDSGDYDTAITFYSKAYQLVQHPVLIFNIAQAHRLAGRNEQALRLYDRYLAADPNGAQAQTVRDIIAEIEARKAEEARKVEQARKVEKAGKADQAHKLEDARKAEATRKAEDARKAEEARRAYALEAARADAQKRAVDAAPSSQEPAQPGPSDRAPGRTLQLSGIAAGAVGVASLALGVGFGVRARSLSNELSQPGADYGKHIAGERANVVQIVGLVGGTVLVAAGATLYWLGHSQGKHQEGVTIAPMVSDHLAGLVLSGSMP
jgi:tetratricopeptide (TPR) repeat protein